MDDSSTFGSRSRTTFAKRSDSGSSSVVDGERGGRPPEALLEVPAEVPTPPLPLPLFFPLLLLVAPSAPPRESSVAPSNAADKLPFEDPLGFPLGAKARWVSSKQSKALSRQSRLPLGDAAWTAWRDEGWGARSKVCVGREEEGEGRRDVEDAVVGERLSNAPCRDRTSLSQSWPVYDHPRLRNTHELPGSGPRPSRAARAHAVALTPASTAGSTGCRPDSAWLQAGARRRETRRCRPPSPTALKACMRDGVGVRGALRQGKVGVH